MLDEEVQLRHDEQNECKVERMDGCMNKLQQFAAHSQMNKGRKEGKERQGRLIEQWDLAIDPTGGEIKSKRRRWVQLHNLPLALVSSLASHGGR